MRNPDFLYLIKVTCLSLLLCLILYVVSNIYCDIRIIQLRQLEAQRSYEIEKENNEEFKVMIKLFEKFIEKVDQDH